jgi:hypothetical protein
MNLDTQRIICAPVRQAAAAALNQVTVYWILQYIGGSADYAISERALIYHSCGAW